MTMIEAPKDLVIQVTGDEQDSQIKDILSVINTHNSKEHCWSDIHDRILSCRDFILNNTSPATSTFDEFIIVIIIPKKQDGNVRVRVTAKNSLDLKTIEEAKEITNIAANSSVRSAKNENFMLIATMGKHNPSYIHTRLENAQEEAHRLALQLKCTVLITKIISQVEITTECVPYTAISEDYDHLPF